jgi:hypothetical protein
MNLAYDIETWQNAFYICFFDGSVATTFTHRNLDALRSFIKKDMVLIGHNNRDFDDILLRHILSNKSSSAKTINDICKRIIARPRLPNDLWKASYAPCPWSHSIDMYQVLSKSGSLKELECRYHMTCVEESPVSFETPLDFSYELVVQKYNLIDTMATWELYKKNVHLIELRQGLIDTYGVGPKVFCQPDAGVTKSIFMHHYSNRTGGWSSTAKKAAEAHEDNKKRTWSMKEIASSSIKYTSAEFKTFFEDFISSCVIGDERGTTWSYGSNKYKDPVRLADKDFQIGVGGLHSVDPPGRFDGNSEVGIFDFDVTSQYPSLIITLGLYPSHIGKWSLVEYKRIRDERIAAKRNGDKKKSEMYKLLLNTYFGVLNEPTSPIRSIPSALKVTINGQLQLLMLIERFYSIGCRILSANTDGVTIMAHRSSWAEIEKQKKEWESELGHELEHVEYAKYYRRDVNNYVAMKADGSVKAKGAFEEKPFKGKTDEAIVKVAAREFLINKTPISETVNKSDKFTDFIYYQRVKNGGKLYYGGSPSGGILRWYVAKGGKPIQRKNPNGTFAMIPNGGSANLAMTLPVGIPTDIDRSYYMAEAKALVESITRLPKPRRKKGEA